MAANPFASLLSGLMPAKNTYIANATAKKSSVPYAANSATGYGGMSLVAAPKTPVTPSSVFKTNAQPMGTSAATGKPAIGTVTSAPKPSTPSNMSVFSTPVAQAASKPTSTSSPRDTFVQNAAATSTYTPPPAAYTPSSLGGTDFGVGGFEPNPSSSPSAGSGTGVGFGGTVTSPAGTGPSYRQQYLDMLTGIYSDDELKSASKSYTDLQKRMSDAQLRERDEEEAIRKNESGALARGVNAQLSENSRQSAKELADLAIAADPYKTYLNNALTSYKTAAEFENDDKPNTDPFTLGEGQVRYDSTGKVIAGTPKSSSTLSSSDPIVQAWAKGVQSKQYEIGNVPEEYRNAVAQAVSGMPSAQKPEVQAALSKAGVMLGQPGADGSFSGGLIDDAISRVSALTSGIIGKGLEQIPGSPAYDLARAVDTIKANLGFQELQAMRDASPTGGALGQVTERELAFLQSTVASLELGQSQKQLKANLEKVKQHYENWLEAVMQSSGGGSSAGGGSFAEEW